MNIYLKQIAGIPQLTAEEEDALLPRLRKGDTAAKETAGGPEPHRAAA